MDFYNNINSEWIVVLCIFNTAAPVAAQTSILAQARLNNFDHLLNQRTFSKLLEEYITVANFYCLNHDMQRRRVVSNSHCNLKIWPSSN